MFALISQLPPDGPRCRCVPAEPRSVGEPRQELARMEGAGDCGQAGGHEGRSGWKHYWQG